ncbi:MAG: hypothetical protein UV05_C0001G0002 [candidate division CPR1 bacterium GW2011_GWA2_42_17]|uniref:Uncharacterized protein n=1 Tax=candidate division CPR1 bacterium GW2011_GWA2_42_17 TaxID=1618341 RepID=A0A0G0Z7N3_9BACT|nr:MAG: hypothetical protein UV05_C0001G0002 [candidate division CPR1 bacterium GW2011_GWA2_42_17]
MESPEEDIDDICGDSIDPVDPEAWNDDNSVKLVDKNGVEDSVLNDWGVIEGVSVKGVDSLNTLSFNEDKVLGVAVDVDGFVSATGVEVGVIEFVILATGKTPVGTVGSTVCNGLDGFVVASGRVGAVVFWGAVGETTLIFGDEVTLMLPDGVIKSTWPLDILPVVVESEPRALPKSKLRPPAWY